MPVHWKVGKMEMFWQRKICVVSSVLSMVEEGNGNYMGFRHRWLIWSPAKTLGD